MLLAIDVVLLWSRIGFGKDPVNYGNAAVNLKTKRAADSQTGPGRNKRYFVGGCLSAFSCFCVFFSGKSVLVQVIRPRSLKYLLYAFPMRGPLE